MQKNAKVEINSTKTTLFYVDNSNTNKATTFKFSGDLKVMKNAIFDVNHTEEVAAHKIQGVK